jgi:ATP-dependent RNA helicase RhlE
MSTSFADLGVSRPLADALRSRGITTPFAVQELVIADVLAGRDVLVQSPTGSGKTLAFGVPLVEKIDPDARRPTALVLAPTRELACQIVDELEAVCAARGVRIAAVYGGVAIGPQIKEAAKAHIVVATPGRLEDLIARRALRLDRVRTLVLDEADRMLDMGFKPPVDRIVALTPRDRQTLFLSATLEGAAGELAAAYTRDARRHVNAPRKLEEVAISHRFAGVGSQAGKLDALVAELGEGERGRVLVFVRTKRGADRLVKKLAGRGVKALAMHGDKSQPQRQRALARFERGDLRTLVATDVAARGIDVAEITQVINFDLPADGDAYTHRVGRTARAGAEGQALSFVLEDQRAEMRGIARRLGLIGELDRDLGGWAANGRGAPAGHGEKPRTQGRSHAAGDPRGAPPRHKGARSHRGGRRRRRRSRPPTARSGRPPGSGR